MTEQKAKRYSFFLDIEPKHFEQAAHLLGFVNSGYPGPIRPYIAKHCVKAALCELLGNEILVIARSEDSRDIYHITYGSTTFSFSRMEAPGKVKIGVSQNYDALIPFLITGKVTLIEETASD